MNSFKSPESHKKSKLDELMGTGNSMKKRKKNSKVKRSPLRTLKQNPTDEDSQGYSSRKKRRKGKHNYDDETKIYSRVGEDTLKFEEMDLEGGSMTMMNTKSELSVKSTKTHKTPLNRRGRKKSPMNIGRNGEYIP